MGYDCRIWYPSCISKAAQLNEFVCYTIRNNPRLFTYCARDGKKEIQIEDIVVNADGQSAAVFFCEELNASDAEAVEARVILGGFGNSVFHLNGVVEVVFGMNQSQIAHVLYGQADHSLLWALELPHAFNGVVQQISEDGVKIRGFDAAQYTAVRHAGEHDTVLFANQALFGQNDIQRLVASVHAGIVDHDGIFHVLQCFRGIWVSYVFAQRGQLVL